MKATVTPTMSARQIASLLGTLESCRPAIWQAPLHFRYLQIRMIQALHVNNQNFDVFITLDHNSLEELRWWVSNINFVNGSPIRPPAPTLFITTDASKTGWGAVCESQRTNGRWSVSERTQHINVLELKAAFLALKSFLKKQSHKVVCLRMDNTTAVAHVNNKGGTHSPCLLALTLELWQWCLERNIMISAQHVPGKLNTIADSESRVFNDSSEWKIDPHFPISEGVQNRPVCLSPIHPTSPVCQLASGSRGTACGCVDNGLGTLQGYAFPPFNLIPAVLNKLSQDKADIILVAPIWPAQPWWPLLLSLLVEQPVLLPSYRHLLRDPADPQRIHPMFPRLHLAVFHVSGDSTRQWEFQTTLRRFSSQHPAHLQGKPINQLGVAGVAGVLRKTDSLSAPLTDILPYLTKYFNSGAAYRSVNVARSAISTSHTKLNGLPVGQNPLVIQLLKGMFNNRPPKPRYSHTWEVSLVTTYLASLGSNRPLSLQQLSWKLAMLFSLTCPERVSALTKLDLRHCHILPDGVEFILSSPRKRGTADQLPKAFFARFPSNSKLCPVETLRCYLKATRSVRPAILSSKPDPLFISYVKPHKPISAPSLARWLRSLLKASGVNSDIFEAHSVRGASTTAAANSNVPLSEILKMADWSSPSTFQKFY